MCDILYVLRARIQCCCAANGFQRELPLLSMFEEASDRARPLYSLFSSKSHLFRYDVLCSDPRERSIVRLLAIIDFPFDGTLPRCSDADVKWIGSGEAWRGAYAISGSSHARKYIPRILRVLFKNCQRIVSMWVLTFRTWRIIDLAGADMLPTLNNVKYGGAIEESQAVVECRTFSEIAKVEEFLRIHKMLSPILLLVWTRHWSSMRFT